MVFGRVTNRFFCTLLTFTVDKPFQQPKGHFAPCPFGMNHPNIAKQEVPFSVSATIHYRPLPPKESRENPFLFPQRNPYPPPPIFPPQTDYHSRLPFFQFFSIHRSLFSAQFYFTPPPRFVFFLLCFLSDDLFSNCHPFSKFATMQTAGTFLFFPNCFYFPSHKYRYQALPGSYTCCPPCVHVFPPTPRFMGLPPKVFPFQFGPTHQVLGLVDVRIYSPHRQDPHFPAYGSAVFLRPPPPFCTDFWSLLNVPVNDIRLGTPPPPPVSTFFPPSPYVFSCFYLAPPVMMIARSPLVHSLLTDKAVVFPTNYRT